MSTLSKVCIETMWLYKYVIISTVICFRDGQLDSDSF